MNQTAKKETIVAQSTKKETLETLLKILLEGLGDRLSPVERVKDWVKQYEKGNKLDELIAIVAQEVIGRIGQAIIKEIKKTKSMDGRRSVEIAVKQLRIIADGYDDQLKLGEKFGGLFDINEDEEDEE